MWSKIAFGAVVGGAGYILGGVCLFNLWGWPGAGLALAVFLCKWGSGLWSDVAKEGERAEMQATKPA